MKTIHALFLAITICGCTTLGTLDVDRVARIAGGAAQLGSTLYLRQNPEATPAFVAVYQALRALDAGGNYDPVAFADALRKLPVDALAGANGDLYISVAIVVWDELARQSAAIDTAVWVRPTLRAVMNGMGKALGVMP